MLRLLISFLVSVIVITSLFWFMQWLITPKEEIDRKQVNHVAFDFVKLKRESNEPQQRKRLPPEPEEKEMPQTKPNLSNQESSSNDIQPIAMDIPMPSLDVGGKFAGAKLSAPSMKGDSELTPLVRVNPRYPRRAAKKGIEGHIKAMIFVGDDGQVKSIEIVESVPKDTFDDSAIKSLKRWKFKPKTVDGKGIEYSGFVTINFNLDQ